MRPGRVPAPAAGALVLHLLFLFMPAAEAVRSGPKAASVVTVKVAPAASAPETGPAAEDPEPQPAAAPPAVPEAAPGGPSVGQPAGPPEVSPESLPPEPEPAPVSPPAPEVSGAEYALAVRDAVSRHRNYPSGARIRRQEGTVVVVFEVDPQGHLAGPPAVGRSSSFPRLDEAAVAAVQAAAPFPPPPDAPGPWRFTLPVEFRLE